MVTNCIAHFEIPAEQPEALTQFYSGMFGWQFAKVPIPGMEYWITGGDGGCDAVTGGVTKKQNPQQPWLNYISVESIEAAIEKGTGLGATVALPKMPIPDGGSIAVLIDPQGNLFGLVQKPA